MPMAPSADTSTTGRHIPSLDGLRGTAILLVLAFHLFSFNPNYAGSLSGRLLARTLDAGWIGVDLFFALSGFLITGILYDTLGSTSFFLNFYVRRSLRTTPIYYGFLLCSLVITSLLGYHWFGHALLVYMTYTSNLLNAGPLTTLRWVDLGPFWSLSVEEHFYLLWPAAMYLLRSKRRIAGVAIVIAVGSVAVRVWMLYSGKTQMNPELPYSWTPARLDTLLYGAVLSLLIRSRHYSRVLLLAPYAASLGILALILYGVYSGGLHRVGDPRMSTVGYSVIGLSACAVIACTLRPESLYQIIFGSSFLRFFGTYSYGLYVAHFTVLRLLEQQFRPFLRKHLPNALSIAATGMVAFALSVALAAISFHWVEKPILALKRHFQDDSPKPKLYKRMAAKMLPFQ